MAAHGVQPERLRRLFLELLDIDSPSGDERRLARTTMEWMRDAGFVCQLDPMLNVIAQRAGDVVDVPRIFFAAHTDTVASTAGLRVREVDGEFRTSGDTILGADDKAAVAAILEAMLAIHGSGAAVGDLQVVFTAQEELGLRGARALSPVILAGSIGFVLDASGPTGSWISSAPFHDSLEVVIRARPADTRRETERVVSSIRATCLASMRLGAVDRSREGAVHSAASCADPAPAEPGAGVLCFEARAPTREALDRQIRHMVLSLEQTAAETGAGVEIRRRAEYAGYSWNGDERPIQLAEAAWRCLGRPPSSRPGDGGSDTNVFSARGIPSVTLTCGFRNQHTVDEAISMSELTAAAEWVASIIRTAAAPR